MTDRGIVLIRRRGIHNVQPTLSEIPFSFGNSEIYVTGGGSGGGGSRGHGCGVSALPSRPPD